LETHVPKIFPTVDSDNPDELLKSLFENASKQLGPDEARRILLKIAGDMADHQARMAQFAKDHDAAGALQYLKKKDGVVYVTEYMVSELLAWIRARHGWA
jgi:hypothetical protein